MSDGTSSPAAAAAAAAADDTPPGSAFEHDLESAMASGDEEALRDVVEKINAAVHEAAGSPPARGSTAAEPSSPPPPVTPPPASGVALSTPSLEGMESPPAGVAMAIPAFPPSPMPRPNLTNEEARAEAAAADAARGLHDNSMGLGAAPPPPVGRAGTPRAGSMQADSAMMSLAGALPSPPSDAGAEGAAAAAAAAAAGGGGVLSSPPPVSSGGDSQGGGSSSDEAGSPGGGWRARAALKAARLRQQADAAVKAATESLEVLDVGAKVASAANAAAETAKQAQVRAR